MEFQAYWMNWRVGKCKCATRQRQNIRDCSKKDENGEDSLCPEGESVMVEDCEPQGCRE